jgi:putative endonuclease
MRFMTVGWCVYMLECAGDRIYTGIAVDALARFEAHRAGRGAAFTRINPPRRLLAVMPCADRSEATRAEAALKKLRRPGKLEWALRWRCAV